MVAGASGLVGSAAVQHFASLGDWDVVGVSRRRPPGLPDDVEHVSVDLTDAAACTEVFGAMDDVTHVVYAAVFEKQEDVVAGWQESDQMETNRSMLVNVLEPLEAVAPLRHVSLLQGTKAYGVHKVWPEQWFSTPARESEPRHPHKNFYWLQQDYLTEKQEGKDWGYTIWRPVLIFGDPVGSNLSVIAVIGAYAALEHELGHPLSYPGGPKYAMEAIDVDLLVQAMAWATDAPTAQCEVFNIANGDVFTWENAWPVIAETLDMEVGEPALRSMTETLLPRGKEWQQVVEKYDLAAPADLKQFIGGSTALADYAFASGKEGPLPPKIVSTIKLRQAGFGACMDTDDMFRKWTRRLQDLRYIPRW